ncbi:MAG: hypothetical protein DRQ55_16395 [Planctomycetota bacterium]|nr:MAG: hypothetical protein DRQ55_16395 [Planctomycetota bacterium]
MHYLSRQKLHLSFFHPLMKGLLTLYILSVAGGVWVASLKYSDRAEFSPAGVERYVHGSGEAGDDAILGDPFAGMDASVAVGKSRRELIDIVHPHLFSVPLVLFILGHLLHLTRIPDWLKGGINGVAFVSFGATFGLPFLVVERATLAPLLYVSGCAMLVSFALLCVIPLWETWFGRPGKGFMAVTSGPRD